MSSRVFFHTQVSHLQQSLVRMGHLSGKLVGDSVAALMAKDALLAREVIERDEEIDQLEDDLEEQTIELIALNQPVACDLRLLVAFLHINTSIERVGDLAVNIAHAAIRLSDKPEIKPFVDIPRTYDLARQMWDDAVRCFGSLDDNLARELRKRDDTVDRVNQETIMQLIQIGNETPSMIYQATNFIGISKALERVADLSVDVADEVVFARRGELRHSARRHTA